MQKSRRGVRLSSPSALTIEEHRKRSGACKTSIPNASHGNSGFTARDQSGALIDQHITSVPVSPMCIADLDHVSSWEQDFGGRGATSVPKPRGSGSSNFLPGLLNDSNMERRLRKPKEEQDLLSLISPVKHQIKNAQNSNFALFPTAKSSSATPLVQKLFQTENHTYNVEDEITTRVPTALTRNRFEIAASTQINQINSRALPTDRSSNIPIQPWAFKIIEKYSSDDVARPGSRCTSRKSMNSSGGDFLEKSLPRATIAKVPNLSRPKYESK